MLQALVQSEAVGHERKTPKACVDSMRKIMYDIGNGRTLLLRFFLPSWRWIFAVVVAAITKTRLLCKSRRVLLPEVREAMVSYVECLRRGEAGG